MDSGEKDLFNEIEKYPVLSDKEQKELLIQYRNTGNEEARQKLINHNLRLCLFVAQKYIKKVDNMTFLELFDENVITLMKAIDYFDVQEEIKLSTYAITAMENNLKRAINNQDSTIRKPDYLDILISKYDKLCKLYNKQYNRNPTSEEIKTELELNEGQLKNLEETIKNKIKLSSLDNIVKDSEGNTELMDFIPDNEKGYDRLNEQYDLNILKNKCKKILTLEEYYIIYYRHLSENQFTLEQLAIEFGVTKERIRQKQRKFEIKLRKRLPYSKENNFRYHEDLDPLPISYILILNELKQQLSKEDYFILYSMIRYKQNNKIAKLLSLNSKQLRETEAYLMSIFNHYNQENTIKELVSKYKKRYTIAQILELNIKISYKDLIDFQKLDTYFQLVEWEDIEKTEYYEGLSSQEKRLIRRYYKQNNDVLIPVHIRQVERELTLNSLGYIKKEKKLFTKNELKDLYHRYEELFTDRQRHNLQLLLFSNNQKCPLKQFEIEEIVNSLLRKEFRIDHFFHNQITLGQIEEVLKRDEKILNSREKNLLFKFYGVGCEKLSIDAIADNYQEPYDKIHDEIANVRGKILKKYYNICEHKKEELSEENKSLYKMYMENPQYEFSDVGREIFSMYLDGKDYKDISEITKLSRTKVSNVVTDALRKCEFYQYQILLPLMITEEDMNQILEKSNYTDLEKQLIKERYINLRQPKELEKRYSINNRRINKLNIKFYREYLIFKCPYVPIEEYKKELRRHPSESILTEEEKKLIALEYGIQSKYNIDGESKTQEELAKIYQITKKSYLSRVESIENKMREKLMGIAQPKYGIIGREELEQLLKDENLPISGKEREILCRTNELNGFSISTEKELAEYYHEKPSSIKRRYDRAILAIKKYQNNLLPRQISYEKEIKKIEKYFSEYDRKLLAMYYEKKLSYEKIGQELGLTYDQVQLKVLKLRLDVSEILNDEITAKKFDFDYARKVLEKPDLPLYYNNNQLAIKIYQMLSGELGHKKYTHKEVTEELNLDVESIVISNCFYQVLLAVEKYKRGVRKHKTIPTQQIISFFEKNESSLQKEVKLAFQRVIKEEVKKDSMLRRQKPIASKALYEILKSDEKNCVKITSIKRENAIKILSNRNLILSPSCKRNIKNYFQIPERELMNGKDKMKVLKLLSPMYQKVSSHKKLQKM